MDEKRYELVEIQVDAEFLEQLEAVIAPMGLTPEMLAVKSTNSAMDATRCRQTDSANFPMLPLPVLPDHSDNTQ